MINLLLVLVLLAVDFVVNSEANTRPLPRYVMSGTLMLLLAFINLLVGMVRNRNRTGDGQYYLLCSGILLLMGFSVCSFG